MNASEIPKEITARIEEIHAEYSMFNARARLRVFRETDSDAGSNRWTEYFLCRPFWSTRWYPQPPPATKRRLK